MAADDRTFNPFDDADFLASMEPDLTGYNAARDEFELLDFDRDVAGHVDGPPKPVMPDAQEAAPIDDDFAGRMVERAPATFSDEGISVAEGAPRYRRDDDFILAMQPEPSGDLGDQGLEWMAAPDEPVDEILEPDYATPGPAPEDLTDEAFQLRAFRDAETERLAREKLTRDAQAEDARQRVENQSRYEESILKAQEKTRRILAETEALSQEGVDNDRWWSSRGTGQKLAAFGAALLGGNLAMRQGGKNIAMDLIMKEIDKDIDTQAMNLQHRRGLIQDQRGIVAALYAQSGDLYEAQEKARTAAKLDLANQIDAQIAQVDPAGTQAMRLEAFKRGIQAEAAGAAQRMASQHRKEAMEMARFDIELQQDARAARKAQDEHVGAHWENVMKQRKATRVGTSPARYSPEYYKQHYGIDVPGPMSVKEFQEHMALRKSAQALTGDQAGYDDIKTELAREQLKQVTSARGVAGIQTKTGSPFQARSEPEAQDLRTMKAAADTATSLMDDIIIAYDHHGAELFGSAAGKRMAADYGALVISFNKASKLGALDAGSQEIIGKSLTGGTKDPEKTLRNFIPAMKKARLNIVNNLHNNLKAHDKDVARYEPDRKAAAAVIEWSPAEKMSYVGKGISEHIQDQDERQTALGDLQLVTDRWLKHDRPSVLEMRKVAKDLQGRIDSGTMKRDEVIRFMQPVASRVAEKEVERLSKKHKAIVQGMSTAEIKEKMADPSWMRELRALDLMRGSQSPQFGGEMFDYLLTDEVP